MGEDPNCCKKAGAEQSICSSVSVNGIEKSSMQLQLAPNMAGADRGNVEEQFFECCQL